LWPYAITPLGDFDLAADVLAYLPLKIDQRSIDGLKWPLPSGSDEADNLGKARASSVTLALVRTSILQFSLI
jgi:hypothetical protein